MRRLVVPLAALALLLAPAIAQAKLSAHLSAGGHKPKAGEKWPITVTAESGGKRVCGKVRYAVIYRHKVVMRATPPKHSFCGTFRDRGYVWPESSMGLDLTFRAIVDTKAGQANLDYAVTVRG